uniref:Glycosyltransferase n=1 Tax=viral metagenome TaxID=1070528 RepID=A0A6C0C2Q5_9ZZZZ
MNLQINTLDDFRRIIAHEPHYGGPILPYSQEEDFKELDELFKNKRVAIVGPSPSLIGKNKGKEIDSYDIVCKVGWMYNVDDGINYGEKFDVLFNGCFPDADPWGRRDKTINEINMDINIFTVNISKNSPLNKYKSIKNIICPIKPCIPGIRDVHNRDIWKHYNYLKKNLPNTNFYNVGLLSCLFDNTAKTRATLGTFSINYLLHSSAKEIGIYGFTWYNNESYHPEYGQQHLGTHGYSYDLEKNLLVELIKKSKKKIYLNEEVKNSLYL